MKLTLLERMKASEALPQEASFTMLKVIKEAREALSPMEKEIIDWEIVEEIRNGMLFTKWNKEKVQEVDIELGEAAITLIRKGLKAMNKQEKLTLDHETVYEKFVENE